MNEKLLIDILTDKQMILESNLVASEELYIRYEPEDGIQMFSTDHSFEDNFGDGKIESLENFIQQLQEFVDLSKSKVK